MLVMAITLVFIAKHSSEITVTFGMLAVVISIFAGIFGRGLIRARCYAISTPFNVRPQSVIIQREMLLEKFHKNGIITGDTYSRVKSTIKLESKELSDK